MTRKRALLLAALLGAAFVAKRAHIGTDLLQNNPFFAVDPTPGSRQRAFAACIVWVAFSVYWEIAAKGRTPERAAESSLSRGFHVFLTNIALLLQIAPILGPGRLLPPSIPVVALGFIVQASGLLLAIWARNHLGKNWSGRITIKEGHDLVRTGPYKNLRHPIYSGILTMYLGTALITGERLGLVGLAVALLAYWRKIRLEDAALKEAFGAEYEAYQHQTWALIPGVL
jgi:protein-S-isoprenylcysteine O-methyltransferase Ste14